MAHKDPEARKAYHKEYHKKWYEANKEKIIKRTSQYNLINKENHLNYRRTAYKNNRAKEILRAAIRENRIKQHQTPSWADLTEINTIYKQATRRSLIEGIKYHVDHIIPLNGDLVSGLHVPDNLQVIPASLNLSKSNQFAI